MAEGAVRADGFFARGLDAISQRGQPSEYDLPEVPGLQRLAPPAHHPPPALEQLLAGHTLDRHIDAEIRPVVSEPELLLPRPFTQALVEAQESVRRASERLGHPAVLEEADRILTQEQNLRELARTCREALHQA